jgi:glycosyltransferase involved in cell wall biosynthesis
VRVAFVCNEYPPRKHGGIGSFVRDLAQALAAGGHEVLVAGWGEEPGTRMDGPVRVVTVPSFRLAAGRKLVNRLRLKRFLEREAAAGRVDVVEAPDYEGTLPFGLANAPVVVRLHQSWTLVHRRTGKPVLPAIQRWERRHLAANGAWIGVSRSVLDLTAAEFRLSPARATVIHNFVAPAPPAAPPDLPRPYVLYAGTVAAWKGALDLARAARLFLPRHPGLSLVYMGREHEVEGRPASAAIREVLGPLAPRVRFTGAVPREQALAAMRGAAVYVMPSRVEANSLAAVEAMSVGCAVVLADSPANREVAPAGENALVVDAQVPEELAAVVSRILDEPGLRDRLSEAARRYVAAHLTREQNVAATLAFYEDVIRAGPHRRAG